MGSELVKPDHLDRKAVVYVRQSTPHQVITNQESLKLQYALSQRARDLGWREADIEVIDSDLGQSGAATGKDLRTWSRASLLVRLALVCRWT
ncbi:resolvase [Bradyrhizobium zhanjiangense]|uniref:resolvase n=1 Tax=Bradyrhizobium zhanjiangense TaxID=1325107 RepID=UPI001FDECAED|nr:resolvase [Bradyrhizobium zhanjiangense]